MKAFKRLFLILGLLLVFLIGAAFAIPYFFKDELLAKAKTLINENVNAKVEFADVGLSIFRHFPDITMTLEELTVDGIETFDGLRLAKVPELDLTLDLTSVIRSAEPIRLEGLHVKDPSINILVTKSGKANYDIAKPTTGTADSSSSSGTTDFRLQLDEYSISNGSFVYDDASLDTKVKVAALNHSGSGDFTATVYDLNTNTTIDQLTVDYGGVQYLSKARVLLDAIFNIDQNSSKYTLKDNELTVNALKLVGNGFVQLKQDDIIMDLDVNAPSNRFKDLLSMIPGAYLQGYEDVKANGTFKLDAKVKGIYNAVKEQLPSFAANMTVNNADVQYPDLPLGITNINTVAKVNSPSSDLDRLTVDVPTFQLQIADNPINGRLKLRTPMSNPDIDTDIKGVLQLEQLAQAFPMEGLEELKGRITADISARANMKQIDRGDYENVDMEGDMAVSDLLYKSAAYPAVTIQKAQMDFSPKFVQLNEFAAQLGKSDLQASGRIDNILAYFSPEATMKGALNVRSSYFDANEWVPESATENTTPSATAIPDEQQENAELFDRFDFALDAAVDEIVYEDYKLKNTVAKGAMTPNRLNIQQASTLIDDSDIAASGTITGIFDYLFENGSIGGDVNLRSRKLDLNQFMSAYEGESGGTAEDITETTANSAQYGVILVPENIKVNVAADVDELIYTNMNIRKLKGVLEVANQAVALQDVAGQALGGTMRFSGMYDTSNPKEPAYSIKTELERLQFQETFKTLNTFQYLAPIGRFIEGIFNTSLALEGTMGDNMMPKLSTLNAQGFLETIDGVIKSFKPMQKIAQTLDIEELKDNLNLSNTRNWVEIKDGKVEVKPFDWAVSDINMTIAGAHGLDRQMNYNIEAAIPRVKLEKSKVGAAASEGLKVLQSQASKLGVKIDQGEFVNVAIALTGTLTDPKVKLNFLGMDGETSLGDAVEAKIEDEVAKKKEELKKELDSKVEEGKDKVKEETQKVVDSAKVVIQDKVGELKDDVKDKVGTTVDSLVQDKVKDILKKEESQAQIDSLKNALKKFNPFKKKTETKKDTSGNGGR